MFNSTILDVAIGMIFIYLLLSLMCSSAREIFELMLKKRSVDLERGIRELLAPGSNSGTDDVVQKLYNHPLVNSLFGGKYEESRIENWFKRKFMRTRLPSYIPARTFALAMMDLVLPGTAAPAATVGATTAKARPSGTAGATPSSSQFEVKLDAPPSAPLPATDTDSPLNPLRNAVLGSTLLTQHAKDALIPLIDAAGSDVVKARENIEGWFNSSMDRVSSWYKRRTQVIILILGVFVAIAVNADSIVIVKKLSTDKGLRETLVAAAIDDAKARNTNNSGNVNNSNANNNSETGGESNSNQSGSSTETVSNTNSNVGANTNSEANTNRSNTNRNANANTNSNSSSNTGADTNSNSVPLRPPPECADDSDSNECKLEKKLQTICKDIGRDSPRCRYIADQERLKQLGLPIGWESQGEKFPGLSLSLWGKPLQYHGLGWLLTAFAISLGAPFWFDLLNKFIVIRSAVKPHEKSPEEESKD